MSKSQPKIAVLLPCYNPGALLEGTLATIRQQTLPSTIFLVDDGSKIKPDYQAMTRGMDVRVIELPRNVGIVGAMNAGLAEILKGDFGYVARMDNGDVNMPDRFEKQVAYLEQNPDVALVGSRSRADFEATGLSIPLNFPLDQEGCARRLRYNATMSHGAIMFRMSFIRDFKAYSDSYPAAEDYAMQAWASAHGHKLANLPEVLYVNIERSNSISNSLRTKQLRGRLAVQWDYADWTDPHTYWGLVRTLALFVLPVGPLRKLRAAMRG
jgi:glycosyltransferase involved in cell wall biosynthesis